MALKIEKADKIGFCYGVRRAINIIEKVALEQGGVETLGPVVHNHPVLNRLAELGVKVVNRVAEIQGDTVAVSSHGVSPQVESEIQARNIDIVNTTCPFVHRAHVAVRRLAEAGFFVVIYGDAGHSEVKGILGYAKGRGVATLDDKFILNFDPLPRRMGILSQTTQVPAHFTEFVKRLIDRAFVKDSELRIIDTICHEIIERQANALELAGRVGLMLVIGGHNSANTRHLAELCAQATKTYLVETAAEIQPSWLQNEKHVGITSGASTDEQTINEVIARLEEIRG